MRARLAAVLRRYRSTGADWPFGDPLRAHGVGMEGYFWRFTDFVAQRVLIALIGVNRGPRGQWATVCVAASAGAGRPARLVIDALPAGWADPDALGAGSGEQARTRYEPGGRAPGPGSHPAPVFDGRPGRLLVDLPGARIDLAVDQPVPWPRRMFGGSSVFQVVPGLNQYWHPWLLGGRASGVVDFDGDRWELAGAHAYGEKNWGRGGFPESWWWGQASFAEPDACVAFAGGQVHVGPLRTEVTALVVRLPDGRVVRLGNPGTSPVVAHTTDDTWRLRGRSAGWRIDVEGQAPLGASHVLPVPLPAEHRNTPGDLEHLAGAMTVTARRHGRVVWRGASRLAGLEHGGLDRAEAELARRGGDPLPR